MAKDLAIVGNIISKPMQISIILNSLPSSWDMAATAPEINFTNLSLTQLLLLKTQQERLNKKKIMNFQQYKIDLLQITSHLNPNPSKENSQAGLRIMGLRSIMAIQSNATSVGKPKHIQKNYKIRVFNNNSHNNRRGNKRQFRQGQNRDIICIVLECFFTDSNLSGWWIDSKVTHHIAKSMEGSINMNELKVGEQKVKWVTIPTVMSWVLILII